METLERTHTVTTERIRQRFSRSLETYDRYATAQQQITSHLAALPARHGRTQFESVFEIGCGTGDLTAKLQARYAIGEWTLNDLCPECESRIAVLPGVRQHFLPGDAEHLPFDGKYDLIASASTFQWIKNPQPFARKLAESLAPGGMLLFSTFGEENLPEIRALTGKGLNYPTLSEWRTILEESSLQVLHAEASTIALRFPTPIAVLRHMKYTGVTATGCDGWTRSRLQAFAEAYQAQYGSADGSVRLTYQPLYFVAVHL